MFAPAERARSLRTLDATVTPSARAIALPTGGGSGDQPFCETAT